MCYLNLRFTHLLTSRRPSRVSRVNTTSRRTVAGVFGDDDAVIIAVTRLSARRTSDTVTIVLGAVTD